MGMMGVEWSDVSSVTEGRFEPTAVFDRDLIVLPDLLIEPSDGRLWSIRLRPLIDSLWQAVGRKGSPNYDANGQWKPGQGNW
jgi:hypothetical protein